MNARSPVLVTAAALVMAVLLGGAAVASEATPADWLDKMQRAVQTVNYEGTVIRIRDGVAESLKVVHVVTDGLVRERVVVQDGEGMEIIRNGNEVHWILPGKKSVLVQEWTNRGTLFSTLPSSEIHSGGEYDLRIVREERVSGRRAVLLAVQPHDEFRFGHRIWLDFETGLPLAANLLGEGGTPLEQLKFAEISLDEEIPASDLEPSFNTDGFRWYSGSSRGDSRQVDGQWDVAGLPRGFRVVSTHEEPLPGSAETVTHVLVSDGLANVSVFVEADNAAASTERSSSGATNTFSLATGSHRVTAVGEVPAATVEQVARALQPR